MFNRIVTVVDRPAIKTAGMKIRTTMEKAKIDCPKLWDEDFCTRMAAFPADADHPGESYGLSIMVDDKTFDYWAVMPVAKNADIPAGLDAITIPAGPYAECRLESLADLDQAFSYVYGPWIAANSQYSLDMRGMSYELYTRDYIENGSLNIYCPLLKQ